MNRMFPYAILALAFSHPLRAQPQYCTLNFTARFQTSLSLSTLTSPVYNNVNNQCTNWAVSVSFPSQIVNPTLTFQGSWDASGKPGTFAPLPPNCIAGGSLSSEVGGAPSSMPVVNPALFTGNGGWGDIVYNNCYFPYVQLTMSAASFPSAGVFTAPSRAAGSAGINPVAAVFAQAAPPSGGGGGSCGFTQTVNAPWFGSPTSSRAPEIVYTNTTGKPICVNIVNQTLASGAPFIVYCDNAPTGGPTTIVAEASNLSGQTEVATLTFVVPPGSHYLVHTTGLNVGSPPGSGGGMWVEWN